MNRRILSAIVVLSALVTGAACSSDETADDASAPTTAAGVDSTTTPSPGSGETVPTDAAPASTTPAEPPVEGLDGTAICGLYSRFSIDQAFGVRTTDPVPSASSCAFPFPAADGSTQTVVIADVAGDIGGAKGQAGLEAYVDGLDGSSTPTSGAAPGAVVTTADGNTVGVVLFGARVLSVTTTDAATEGNLAAALAALPVP